MPQSTLSNRVYIEYRVDIRRELLAVERMFVRLSPPAWYNGFSPPQWRIVRHFSRYSAWYACELIRLYSVDHVIAHRHNDINRNGVHIDHTVTDYNNSPDDIRPSC